MDPLTKLSDAARQMSREVSRRRMEAAFASPDEAERRSVGDRLAGAVAKHRATATIETWQRFEVALEQAMATGECDALTDAFDALEAERLAAKAAAAGEPDEHQDP